jgi:hypothetical protein
MATTEEKIKAIEKTLANEMIPEALKEDLREELKTLKGTPPKKETEKTSEKVSDFDIIKRTYYWEAVSKNGESTGIEGKTKAETLKKLKENLSKTSAKKPTRKTASEKRKAVKKETPPKTTSKKPSGKKIKIGDEEFDCDDLAEREAKRVKERRKRYDENKTKRPATKNSDRIEKTTELIEKSIEKRISQGKTVSKSEIEKMIEKAEALIRKLKKLLKDAK